ncbi:MAG: AzlC family ABC transporter permease [Devosiaceae bacterium]|nr:AzlC family ABC transporter permease [Devosiaceae bacterium MH13]
MGGFWLGFRRAFIVTPGIVVFGAGFGAAAAVKGLTFLDAFLFQSLVLAGASQYVALELWTDPLTWTTAFAMGAVVFTVNLRMMLLGAAMRPWIGNLPAYKAYPALAVMTDPAWIIGIRYYREGGRDWGVYLGACIFMYLLWIVSVIPGYFASAAVDDPERFALDLVMPIFFITMLVPLWRGRMDAAPWIAAVLIALLTKSFVPGYWFVLVGGIAAAVTAALLYREGEEAVT